MNIPDVVRDNTPHSTDAEQCVLGGLMLDNNRWDDVASMMSSADFYTDAHKRIFSEMARLMAVCKPLDLITLTDALGQQGTLAHCGGFAYLAELGKNIPSAANILAYVDIVVEKSHLRRLLLLGRELCEQAVQPGAVVASLNERVEQQLTLLSDLTMGKQDVGLISGLETLTGHLEQITGGNGITGTPTGFAEFDRMTCGLQAGELILLAARPSMGKTAFALACCTGALRESASPVFCFSLEMPRQQLLMRLVAMEGRVPLSALRSGQLNNEDWARISLALSHLSEWESRLIIDDSSCLAPSLLRSLVRRYVRQFGTPSLIMIDYLQLMSCPERKENRTQEIADISRNLKALGREIGCPVLALSQLNRQLESRADKRPNNGDLRDSGALEQDADVIAFIYRDEVYNANSQARGTVEVIISKQRQGPTGTLRVKFEGEFTAFCDVTENNSDTGSVRA
ncbi:replicative DNA helicase [Rouxiella badensis]|uniref:SPI-7-type island replicative DNA helicase n=1 Tax=Rouxiella badensis TaxID=1646377 RepID=UPI001D1466A1|nr:SPI-7-type island replicative DNA helicase [Rouxiella badensis]MCC3705159.1 replicative DNA helicase [Rouxiella badensis]